MSLPNLSFLSIDVALEPPYEDRELVETESTAAINFVVASLEQLIQHYNELEPFKSVISLLKNRRLDIIAASTKSQEVFIAMLHMSGTFEDWIKIFDTGNYDTIPRSKYFKDKTLVSTFSDLDSTFRRHLEAEQPLKLNETWIGAVEKAFEVVDKAANEAFEAAKRAADEAFKAAKRTTERAGDDDASSDGTPVSGESEPTNKEPCQAKARRCQ
jgi:hypothetical protein